MSSAFGPGDPVYELCRAIRRLLAFALFLVAALGVSVAVLFDVVLRFATPSARRYPLEWSELRDLWRWFFP